MNMPPVAIIAGGLATRMYPVTKTVPKSLIPVRGEPFLAHQLRLVRRQGFRSVVICVGHLGEEIERFVNENGGFELDVKFSHDGDLRRGTGGAVRNALPILGECFFTLYGDSYLDVDVRPAYETFLASRAPALMMVFHNRNLLDKSNVIFDGEFVRSHAKSDDRTAGVEWIDYGMSVMKANVVADWPTPDPFDLSSLTAELAARGQLAGYEVDRRFYEIGSHDGLDQLEAALQNGERVS
jgi:NDP-sugar pyrophosphorylase family protein